MTKHLLIYYFGSLALVRSHCIAEINWLEDDSTKRAVNPYVSSFLFCFAHGFRVDIMIEMIEQLPHLVQFIDKPFSVRVMNLAETVRTQR